MGYYCTVPQCTSLAGKTKNVKFHRFPRDIKMADKWNVILKRGKPYTQYSKVCSLHFTQGDYNVTAMGQWKTLSKDAVPTQNLPKLNPDGTVMVIRKSRSIKYKEQGIKKEIDVSDKPSMEDKYASLSVLHSNLPPHAHEHAHAHHDTSLPYRLHSLNALADNLTQVHSQLELKPRVERQDAVMQTDPQEEEEEEKPGCSDTSESFHSEQQLDYNHQPTQYERNEYPKDYTKPPEDYTKPPEDYTKPPEDYTKTVENYTKTVENYNKPLEDYIPQTNEEYNKEAEKYALERKSHYDKAAAYSKIQEMYDYTREQYPARYEPYGAGAGGAGAGAGGAGAGAGGAGEREDIKQEDLSDEAYLYERSKEALEANTYSQQRLMQQRLLDHVSQQVKVEPDVIHSAENVMQPQGSPYYQNAGVPGGYYQQFPRPPGPELLIAKQNALAAHTQLWQNTMKRPFFYSDSPHYNGSLHRYEDLSRILQ